MFEYQWKFRIKKKIIITIIFSIWIIIWKSLFQTHFNSQQNYGFFEHIKIIKNKFQPNNLSSNKILSFSDFKKNYLKNYDNQQEQRYRELVFVCNRQKIKKMMQNPKRTFNSSINKFSDLTSLQFRLIYTNTFVSNTKIQNYAQKLVDSKNKGQFLEQKNQIQIYLYDQINQRQKMLQKQQTSFQRLNYGYNTKIKTFRSHEQNKMHSQYGLARIIQKHQQYENFEHQQNQIFDQQEQFVHLNRFRRPNFHFKLIPQKLILKKQQNQKRLLQNNSFIDWTKKVGNVRFQGICGACYTFATADVLASLYAIHKFNIFVPLSVQQVLDCADNGLTNGCNGGFLQGALAYMQLEGLKPDILYPYRSLNSRNTFRCLTPGGPFRIRSFVNLPQQNCPSLISSLSYGPLSIGIAGYQLQFYSQGIFNDCNDYIDHAVVLVGWKEGVGWKIKNSWGEDWGMSGFAWIKDGNNCGVCNMAVAARI